ncbi:MAG TPA: sigma 54-interacting transcriptional regulator [Planctomycetota bacterium]|nr:sigma 54-interacting transcriptional regulator [Planctomycetota bacterium]
MSESAAINAFVEAYLLGDKEAAADIVANMPPAEVSRPHCSAILAAWRAQTDMVQAEDAARQLKEAHLAPPDDADLMLVLLMASVRFFANTDQLSEAQRSLRLLKALAPANPPPPVGSAVIMTEVFLLDRLGRKKDAHELTRRAAAMQLPVHCNVWYSLRLALAHTAMNAAELGEAEAALSEVAARPPANEELLRVFRERSIRLLMLKGQAVQALAQLDAMPAQASEIVRRRRLQYRVRSLLYLGRFAEAGKAIDDVGPDLAAGHREYMRAIVCLHRGDAAGALDWTNRALRAGRLSPMFLDDNAAQMALAELMAGRASAARTLLKMLDAEERDPFLDTLWAQVCMLEGQEARAARHFRRILDRKDPCFLRESLRDCVALTGLQIARLWTLAEGLPPEPDASAAEGQAERRSDSGAAEAVMIGESSAIREVRQQIARFAPLAETVLITGETGTGKELAARLLHDRGPRAGDPFIAVNCAAISDTLIESELFGHVKGAFTGATQDSEGLFRAAGDGTLFLDEISSMSARLQGALLRVLEDGEIRPVGSSRPRKVRARVIAASNQPLEALVEAGGFRADLYYRLARLHLRLPPLRERLEDLPLLVGHFLRRAFDYGQVAVGEDLLKALAGHSWPGNVRELQNEIERIVLLSGGQPVLGAGLFVRQPQAPSATPMAQAAEPVPEMGAVRAASGQVPRLHKRLTALRDLFAKRKELTRAEVVEFLGCAPNSATGYLRRLEKDGLIERIHTSAALRTSYFALRSERPSDRQ